VTDLAGGVGASLAAVDVDEIDLLLDHLGRGVAGCFRYPWVRRRVVPSFFPVREVTFLDVGAYGERDIGRAA
jgi:hypothetical protein